MLSQLIEGVRAHTPQVFPEHSLADAAVLVAVTRDEHNPEIILTLRSTQLPTHKGEVAFAGGKTDPEDADAVATALREAHEEVGIAPAQVEVVGALDQVVSRFGFVVTPVLGLVAQDIELHPDPRELQAVFRVPLKFFLENEPAIDQLGSFRVPRWQYENFMIWGLTAMMIAQMMNQFYGATIELQLDDVQKLLA
ncbi:MAG: CoA pyrophosphatase [Oceanospirillaceae bacterium]|nr:CoA pyrophosphatase [Oceanospirillaceae bacterium]MCP5335832.1 CoA pyrophosphatase [Oceanospirillaceae bacterium]MCP5349646.1 CoA pyrophosphatase [Oceanospirillaceae bacterium]